jgi:transposase
MRSIVRRDTGETYQAYLTQLAEASGITTPTREALARFDRRRKKKSSNTDWTHPTDPDAKITKMKDGRTHLAHKAEHAVDVDSGAVVSVRVDGADVGDTATVVDTVVDATEQLERAGAPHGLEELIADKGYHSNRTLIDLQALDVRAYIAEPDRGRRRWHELPEAQALVYANRRRVRGARGGRLRRRRAEYAERSFAHLYETGAMRRTHLRGHQNILKRLWVHAGAFNLGLIMRRLIGHGTPRGLSGRLVALVGILVDLGRSRPDRWSVLPGIEALSWAVPTYTTVDLAGVTRA